MEAKNLYICKHPLVQGKLSLLRDESTDSKMFRELLKEIGMLISFEVTNDLTLEEKGTGTTGYGSFTKYNVKENVAVVPILRSGLGLLDGNYMIFITRSHIEFNPECWNPPSGYPIKIFHLGIFRDKSTQKPVEYYNKLPPTCAYDCCIILDAMIGKYCTYHLATGGTCIAAITALKEWGAKKIKVLAAVGSEKGIQAVFKKHPEVQIYVAAVDRDLDSNGYIIPGLGDAGDRLFRTK